MFEEALLRHYQGYLQQLGNLVQQNMPRKTTATGNAPQPKPNFSMLLVAVQCLCKLLDRCSHFNFRLNVMSAVVSRMNLRLPSGGLLAPDCISKLCCQAIEDLFRNDEFGENSLEGVKLISKLIKTKNFNVPPRVLDTFLALSLTRDLRKDDNEDGDDRRKKFNNSNKKNQPFVTKKAKKQHKVDDELEKELKEAEASLDKDEKQKLVGASMTRASSFTRLDDGNPQASLCDIFPRSEECSRFDPVAICLGGSFQVWTLDQRGIL